MKIKRVNTKGAGRKTPATSGSDAKDVIASGRWRKVSQRTYSRVTGEVVWGAGGRWHCDGTGGRYFKTLGEALAFVECQYKFGKGVL